MRTAVHRQFVTTAMVSALLAFAGIASAAFGPKGSTLGAGVATGGTTAGPGNPTAPPQVPNALDAAKANGGSITLGDDSGKTTWALVPPSHTVRKGDTLWEICDQYFNNPWQWPRVWSYNPDILNPHWIYPGEVIRLKSGGGNFALSNPNGNGGVTPGGVLKPKSVKPGTIFLRDLGFIYDSKTEDTGEIVGSPEDRMLLTTYNKVYVRVTDDQAKKLFPGDSLTVFRQTRSIKSGGNDVGKIVQILGTIKVDTIDKKTNLVEGTIVEALDVIERGSRVGPVERRLDVVAPATNDVDLRGTILASVQPTVIYGANQVVMVDKGAKQGLKVGNRLFVVRKGDPWKKGLSASGELAAQSVTLNTDGVATTDKQPDTPADSPDYPDEVIAEIRVVRVRDNTATCLVTSSKREMEPGDGWVMKKGY
jgi:hypothetical protein